MSINRRMNKENGIHRTLSNKKKGINDTNYIPNKHE